MMDAALTYDDGRTLLDLKVTTGAPKGKFPAGNDEWRERVKVKVASQARNGEANKELVETLENFFSTDPVRITAGRKNSKKTVEIPAPVEVVLGKLKDGME